ncbi:MAG: MFS transporter [Chloroflexota bacterium]|nr:MFS transporter [Chloroflexota bacterium]
MGLRLTGLWRHPDFTKLWVAQTVSSLGTGITGQALPFTAILVLGASAGDMGLLAAASQLPVLAILFAGVWADRLRRRPILIAADVGRAALLVTIPVAAVLGVLGMGQLFAVAMLVEALSLFFSVAYRSYLPTLIPREQLVDGNSKLSAGGSVAEISGPAVGGVLVQWLTAPFAILFDAASFLFSALFLGAIRTSEPLPAPPEERKSVRNEIGEGLQVVLRNRVLRALAACSGTFTFFGNFFHALYVLYAMRDQGIPPGIVGVLVGAGGAGALVGAVLVGPVTRRFGVGPTLIGSLTFSALVGFPIVLVDGPLPFTIAVFFAAQLIGDIAIAIYLINDMSLRQAMVPDRLLGRANASMGFLVGGLGPVGALVGGALGELIGARYTLAIAIIAISLAPLWLFFSPARTLREAPVIAEPAS